MTTISRQMQSAIDSAPAGKSGLVCVPWSAHEVYGVAADWSQASDQVLTYGEDGWVGTGRQVADYCHSDRDALRDVIVETLEATGCDGDADDLMSDAVGFGSETRYSISDSNASTDDVSYTEAVESIRDWYADADTWSDGHGDDDLHERIAAAIQSVDEPQSGGDLANYASDICDAVARAMGGEDFAGHGRYSVSAADSLGLSLTVTGSRVSD